MIGSTSARCRALFTELDQEMVRCPYDLYAAFRDRPPEYVDEVEAVVVARFSDVHRVLMDAETFSSARIRGPVAMASVGRRFTELAAHSQEMRALMEGNPFIANFVLATEQAEAGDADERPSGPPPSPLPGPTILASDGEQHTRRRSCVVKAFTPKRLKQMEPEIRAIADRLIDAFVDRGRVEFVSEFAMPLPVEVIARAIGVADADIGEFRRWSDALFGLTGVNWPTEEAVMELLRSQTAFIQYFTPRIEARREHPADDLLQDLLNAEDAEGDKLTRSEAVMVCSELVSAGNQTTTDLLANTMQILARCPEVLAAVREDRGKIPALLEESLRLVSPIQGFYRTATTDTDIGGVEIAAGTAVLLLYGSANRDEHEFPDAASIDLERPNTKRHVAFGRGRHACLGSGLARTEGRIAIEAVLDRLGELRAVEPADAVRYRSSYLAHGPARLELTFAADDIGPRGI